MADQEFNATTSESFIYQSVLAQSNAAAGLDLSAEIIVCSPFDGIAEYQGTRAALEAEGVIPTGTVWPDGFDSLYWGDDNFSYWLRRERPEGVKGPRKQFLGMDWWMFRCDPVKVQSWEAKAIEKKAKALASEIYRQSPNGRAEWGKQLNAYMEARRDDKFQAFKALIPGIVRPKRGRRPKEVQEAKSSQN